MKVMLDACVLFPTVLREVLITTAAEGGFTPLWSPRVLEEWARAAARYGPADEAQARAAAALMEGRWPRASVTPHAGTQSRLWLPDPNDIHVLAAASDGGADLLVTLNLRDFPRREVRAEGLEVLAPDPFLYDLWLQQGDLVERAVRQVLTEAAQIMGRRPEPRALLKRAKLPRLGKALAELT